MINSAEVVLSGGVEPVTLMDARIHPSGQWVTGKFKDQKVSYPIHRVRRVTWGQVPDPKPGDRKAKEVHEST